MGTFLSIEYQVWWLIAVAVLLLAYAVLDGFDLGAGTLHLFLKTEEEKQTAMKAIAPIWDGNEVLLLIGGGALFAGFPAVYATLFSAMYVPLMLFLLFLVTRAVSIEFRNKEESKVWRKSFDLAYGISSAVLAVLLGVVVGNILLGMPLDNEFEFTGSWLGFLNPYSLVLGLLSLAFCVIHGGLFLRLKTEGAVAATISGLIKKIMPVFVLLFTAAVVYSLVLLSSDHANLRILYFMVILVILSVLVILWTVQKDKYALGFIASSFSLVLMMILILFKHFPYMIINTTDPANSMTIFNSSGSEKNLQTMLIIAAIGVPIVIFYVYYAYKTFWGKIKKEDLGY